MKTNLTNKDKKLLLFMFLFVIIVGVGYWGVYPQIREFIKLDSKIDEQEVLQSVNEQKLANISFVEMQCGEYETSMAENKEKFFDRMSEADVDLLLTGKAIKHKLESLSLNIMIPDTPSARKAYRYSELYNRQTEIEAGCQEEASSNKIISDDDLLEVSGKKKKNKDKEEDEIVLDETVDIWGNTDTIGTNNDIYAARVTMVLGGDRKNLEAFLEEIMNSDKEILITSFAWSKYRIQRLKGGGEDDGAIDATDYEIVELDALTVTMELYMCDKD